MEPGGRGGSPPAVAEGGLTAEALALRSENAALRRSVALLRAVVDGIDEPVSARDERGIYLLANPAACRLLGRPEAEVVGRGAADLFAAEAARRVESVDREVMAEGRARTVREVADEGAVGRVFATTTSPRRDEQGRPVGVVAVSRDVTQGVRAEEELRAGERRFRAIFEGALDAMALADDEGRFLDANPSACALFGLPRDRLIGRSVAEFVDPEPGFDAAWAAFLVSETSRGVMRLARADGSAREVEFAASADVLPGLHLSVLRDVTERARADEAVRDSERRVVAILESITDGFVSLDRDWRFTYVNAQAGPMLGRDREELLGRDLWSAFPDAVGSAFERQYRRAMTERVPIALEAYYPPLGRWFRVHAHPSAEGLSVYFADVSESREAEEALRRSERRFRDVLENSRDVIYRLDLRTRLYDYISPSVRDVLGPKVDEIEREGLTRLLSLVHPEDLDRHAGRVAALMSPGSGEEIGPVIEYRVRVPGKGWRWLSDSGTLIRDEAGRPAAVVGNVRDVTDQKASAERLRELSRRLIRAQEEERSHIARELHDEIGQALTAIKLNVRAAQRDPASPESARRLEDGLSLVERTIGQVRDLSLDLRPSMLDDLGLDDALRSLVSSFALSSGVAAEFVAAEEPGRSDPEVETACYRVAQEALTNVARHAGAGRLRVELSRSEGELGLIVADDGRGFDVAAATERASGGASLGVLGMRERAMLVGGRLVITSEPGRGTEVRVTLPRKTPGDEPGDPGARA